MGKGRGESSEKKPVKKGAWTPEEDLKLITFIKKHGHQNWRSLPNLAGLTRCGKSCRLRWTNYLRPGLKRGNFTKEEEDVVLKLQQTFGNKWTKIASHLPGRTDNEIKNVWNTRLKKRVTPKQQDSDQSKDSSASDWSSSSSTTTKPKKRKNAENKTEDDGHRDTDIRTVTKKPRVSCGDTKPILSSNSSSSSNNSNITNSTPAVDLDSLQEADEFAALQLEDFWAPPDFNLIGNIRELEMNKPEIQEMAAATEVEIPLDSDFDLWNTLDGLIHFEDFKDDNNENSSDQSSNLGEIENKKWLRYIENELGLAETTANGGEHDSAKGVDMEMKPENPPES